MPRQNIVFKMKSNALLTNDANAAIVTVEYGTHPSVPQLSKTVHSVDKKLEDGALRAGPPPKLLSPEVLALLMQYAGIGFINGVLPAVIYPVLQGYLNAEGTIIVSATVLLQLPWSYKVFLGVLSDCFPIVGFRRRPYMLIGWLLCCCMLFMMATLPDTAPYYGDPSMHFTSPDEWTETQRKSINPNAPDAAGKYVIPMMMVAFGYLLVEVPADAVTIEYSQREPVNARGHLQSWIHSLRMGFSALGALVVAVAFNGVEYGGSFDFSLTFPRLMFFMGCVCLPLGPAAWFLVYESQVDPPKFRVYMAQFWKVLQKRAVYQVAAYKFFSGVCNNFNIVSSSNMKLYWVHATPFNASMMAIVGTFTYAGTLAVMAQRGLRWNWHIAIATTVIFGVATDCLMTMMVTWDIIRSQWFWLGVPIIGEVPHAVRFIVSNYIVVELVQEGTEGALYGLLTTTNHVAAPFGRTTAKIINARFHVWKNDIIADTYETRRDVTFTIWLCYGMKFVSLIFLPLLPNQRDTTQALCRQGEVSKCKGMWMVVILLVALVWFTVVNVLSMNPATKCWTITGGSSLLQGSNIPSSKLSSFQDDDDKGLVRLAKLMAQQGLCSRREADAYIQAGDVLVNGKQVQAKWITVPRDSDVRLDFRAQRHQNEKVTLILNKPLGFVSSQPESNKTPAVRLLTFENECQVLSRVKPRQNAEPLSLQKMAVCGRLDVNSSGLLLFTQDGKVAKKLLDPKGGIEKEYLVRVDLNLDPVTGEIRKKVEMLRAGVTSEEGITYRAKSVEVLNANQLRVILTEGKNRHLRRMCEHVGLGVVALKRVRIGSVKLGSLPVGQWRYWQPTDRI
ncbi:unnamed protein product [Peronospora farinosa]|uniref:RNA-binding S4 domain-containing protein n=1 Tax=Peronospora farinosa TaxID=134698 RepID=A0ABN8BTS6_9STRA|nr:unnamed protein product [Peronospora farinosa]